MVKHTSIRRKLGDFVRRRRKELGISARVLAERIEMSRSYVSTLEHARARIPNARLLERLAAALRIRSESLWDIATEGEKSALVARPNPYEDPHPALTTRTERRLLAIVKLAYLKQKDPDSGVIGWEELGDRLCDEICNAIGSDEFCKWLDEVRG